MDSNEVGKVEEAFQEWLWQIEGFHLYGERFLDEVQHGLEPARAIAWLRAAFEAGLTLARSDESKVARRTGTDEQR